MNFDFADLILRQGREEKGKKVVVEVEVEVITSATEAYRKVLAEAPGMDWTLILAFKNKPSSSLQVFPPHNFSTCIQLPKPRGHIPKKLDVPNLLDDYYLNLLDWGSSNFLAIALGSKLFLLDASNYSTSELVTIDDKNAPITSVNWAPDRFHIAIGLKNSQVRLWDCASSRKLRTLKGGHRSIVGSLA